MTELPAGRQRQVLTDAQLVADAVAARREAEETEEEASPSRWREADDYLALAVRGWSVRRIATECETNKDTVSYFVRCARLPRETRGSFWVAYQRVRSDKSAAERIVASDENEWYTPTRYVEAAREVLDAFDLDPASSEEANRRIGAAAIWTEEDDGLRQPWYGRIWLNPPYGRLAEGFTRRLVTEYAAQSVEAAVLLVNAHCTDTKWFQPLWDQPLCFTDHRIDFEAPEGREKKTTSTHGSVFAYFGPRENQFAQTFATFGPIVRRWP